MRRVGLIVLLLAGLAEVRARRAALLRERYMNGQPDRVTVVLNAHGFKDLLETVSFLHRVQQQDTHILQLVRDARADAVRERGVLTELAAERARTADAVRRHRDALSS